MWSDFLKTRRELKYGYKNVVCLEIWMFHQHVYVRNILLKKIFELLESVTCWSQMLKNINVFQTSPNTNFPQLSYILITSCIQEFQDYVQSKLLYGLRLECPSLRPSTHHSTSAQFGLDTTSAICMIYTIYMKSHPDTVAVRTRQDIPNH